MVLDSAKEWWNGDKKEEKKNDGWCSYLKSAASTVGDYSSSAASSVGSAAKSTWNSSASTAIKSATSSTASTIGSSAKAAWNSEIVSSTSSTVKNAASSTASTIGNSAKAAWNSDAVASTSSAIKSATSSTASTIGNSAKAAWSSEIVSSTSSAVKTKACLAGNGVWSWWNQTDNEKTKKIEYKTIGEEKKTESSSWGYVGSAASTVKDYSFSAASSIGNSAKNAWNSDAVASTSSAITGAASSTASTIGNSAKSAWNSDIVSSTTSTVSSGFSGIQSWWNGSKSEEKSENSSGDFIRGGIAAMSKNASKYVISTAGRSSNILNIFDKTNRSSLGNPRWWVRFDRPHGSVNYPHININKAVTGLKDPHIQIAPITAKTVGVLGKFAEKANDWAPFLATTAMIYEAWRVGKEVKKDYDFGTTRNTVDTVITTTATYTAGSVGAYTGGLIGSSIFPGIGTIFGGIVGGVLAGYYGGQLSHVATEKAMDHIEWDIATLECIGCKEEYTWKKYQEIEGICCTPFNSKNQGSAKFWFDKLHGNHDF